MKRSAAHWVVVSSFIVLTCFDSGLVQAAGTCEPGWQPVWAPFARPLGSCGPAPTATVYDDGSGPAIYVGGSCYDQVGGIKDKIFRWDGTAWSGLGMRDEDWGRPRVLVVYRSELIAAGGFQSVAGVTAHGIARWNGTRWAPLAGPDGKEGVDGPIMTATVYKDELIISGYFTQAGGVPCNQIARWDGANWSPLGMNGGLTPHDPLWDGGASCAYEYSGDFYLGGWFSAVDGVPANNVARWNGATWTAMKDGNQNGLPSSPFDMTVYQGKLIFGLQPDSNEAGFPEAIRTWDGNTFGVLKGNDGNGRFLTVHKGELFSHGGWRGGIRRWNGSFWSKTGPDEWPEIIIEYQGKLLTFAGYDQAQWYEWKLSDLPDADGDGLADQCDPHPLVPGLLTDSDGDGTIDVLDNCPSAPNSRQHDLDADGIGDMCDDDVDGDAVPNTQDNCPDYANADQADANGDGRGDACGHCFSGTFVMVDDRQYLAVTMTPCNYVEQMPPQPDVLNLPVTLHLVVALEGEGYRLSPDTPVGGELAIAEGENTTAKTLAEEDTASPACGAGAVMAQLGAGVGLLGLRARRRGFR